jgi:predicted methyltransferase
MYKIVIKATKMAQGIVEQVIRENDTVIDATLGNGYDTLFLSKLVPSGRVYSFDIQYSAIEGFKKIHGDTENVHLIHDGHENINKYVKERPMAIMFNLGYLPGGDENFITKPETTIQALNLGLQLLSPGGIISIVSYIYHKGGQNEADEVLRLVQGLDPREFSVMETRFMNVNNAPFLLIIEKNDNYHVNK